MRINGYKKNISQDILSPGAVLSDNGVASSTPQKVAKAEAASA